jgi:hypothetical protein
MTVVTRMLLLRSSRRPSSSTSLLSLLWTYPTRDTLQGSAPPRVDRPSNLERERKARKRGRKHAIDDAVMPMPGSTVDQMDTSVFEYKKSSVLVN